MYFNELAAWLGSYFCLYGIHTEKSMVKRPISAFPGFDGFWPFSSFANLPRSGEHDDLVIAVALAVWGGVTMSALPLISSALPPKADLY